MKHDSQSTETRPSEDDPFQRYARGEIRVTEFLDAVLGADHQGSLGKLGALCELAGYLRAGLLAAEKRIRTGNPWEYRLPGEKPGTPYAGGGVA